VKATTTEQLGFAGRGEGIASASSLFVGAGLSTEPVRLFFALWPEASLQQALYEAGNKLLPVLRRSPHSAREYPFDLGVFWAR